MNSPYNFPPNKRAELQSTFGQLLKIAEEKEEVFSAFSFEPTANLLEECWDLIYAVEGLLRKYDDEEVMRAYERVIQKAFERGDLH